MPESKKTNNVFKIEHRSRVHKGRFIYIMVPVCNLAASHKGNSRPQALV